jgi:hypothetical protein
VSTLAEQREEAYKQRRHQIYHIKPYPVALAPGRGQGLNSAGQYEMHYAPVGRLRRRRIPQQSSGWSEPSVGHDLATTDDLFTFFFECKSHELIKICQFATLPSLNSSIQTQKITELVKDIHTPHFTLSTNSPPPTNSFIFVLIHRNAYIVSKILNPTNANIKGRRE